MERRTWTVGIVIIVGLIVLCLGGGTIAGFFVYRTVEVQQARHNRQRALSNTAINTIVQMALPAADDAEFEQRLDASAQQLFALLEPQDSATVRYTFDGKTFQAGPAKGVLSPETQQFEESHTPDEWNEDANGLSVQSDPFATRTTQHVVTTVGGKPCLVLLTWEITEK